MHHQRLKQGLYSLLYISPKPLTFLDYFSITFVGRPFGGSWMAFFVRRSYEEWCDGWACRRVTVQVWIDFEPFGALWTTIDMLYYSYVKLYMFTQKRLDVKCQIVCQKFCSNVTIVWDWEHFSCWYLFKFFRKSYAYWYVMATFIIANDYNSLGIVMRVLTDR